MSEGKLLASDRCGRVYREARVQARMIQSRNRKWEVGGLKTGQRRDVRMQRRDVLERTFSNVATLRPTSRRSREKSVPTS